MVDAVLTSLMDDATLLLQSMARTEELTVPILLVRLDHDPQLHITMLVSSTGGDAFTQMIHAQTGKPGIVAAAFAAEAWMTDLDPSEHRLIEQARALGVRTLPPNRRFNGLFVLGESRAGARESRYFRITEGQPRTFASHAIKSETVWNRFYPLFPPAY